MSAAGSRLPSIEALRVVAICGIAVFHTFQPWVAQLAAPGDAAPAMAALAERPLAVLALGFIALLGAYGNHVFFAISGYFLIPRAAQASTDPGYWREQVGATGRRILPIVCSVALYAGIALVMDVCLVDIPRVSPTRTSWLLSGLQFIWVYVALVVLAPMIGWAWRRLPNPVAVLALCIAAVCTVNFYIAFVSPGEAERSLLEWRKLMSAVSYGCSFTAGAGLHRAVDALRTDDRTRPGRSGRVGTCALAAAIAAALAAESVAALPGNAHLVVTLSYKTTSALSLALALASVLFAATRAPRDGGRGGRIVPFVTSATLGFYILQSIASGVWHPIANTFLELVLEAGGALSFVLLGTIVSIAFVLGVCAVDRIVRQPVIRRLERR